MKLEAPDSLVARAGHRIDRVVYTAEEIETRVREMGTEISEAYADTDDLLVLGLLKGSFIFLADLVRHISIPLHVDFLVATSYGDAKVSSGNVSLVYDAGASLEGRSVVLVEDIVDSGNTITRLIPELEARGPRSLEVCALLHKRLAQLPWEPRWVGFDCPQDFLVGYGLDYSENFRHLPFIVSLAEE